MPRQALTTKSGRPAAFHNKVKERIKVSMIVGRVQQCALGEVEMTSTQLAAAKLLINKLIPDAPREVHDAPHLSAGKDISHADPHQLLRVIEGEAERK